MTTCKSDFLCLSVSRDLLPCMWNSASQAIKRHSPIVWAYCNLSYTCFTLYKHKSPALQVPPTPSCPPQPAPLPPCTSQIWLQGQSTGLCGGGGSKWPRPQQCGVELKVYKAAFLLSGPHKRDIWESGGSLNMQTSVVLLVLLAVASHTVASKCKTETCCFWLLTIFSYCRNMRKILCCFKWI